MPSITIQRTWNVNGVPTDVTSVVLRDALNTFGVKRADTGTVVVLSGTAFTRVAPGVYEYTLTGLAAGVTYLAATEVVYLGRTDRFTTTHVATAVAEAVPVVTGDATIDGLLAARANYAAILADISAIPKPDYNVHGHSYSWAAYQTMLREQIDGITRTLAVLQPFEISSQGII